VHDALNVLYDSVALRGHPLAGFLQAEANPAQRGPALRRTLVETIRSLRPSPGIPAHSPDWRAYHILQLRYVEGLTPDEVMSRVALGRSQYFREQGRVLEALVGLLWDKVQRLHEANGQGDDVDRATRERLIRSETERFSVEANRETVHLSEVLEELRGVVKKLAEAQGVPILVASGSALGMLRADRVLLRQAILNAIIYALSLPALERVEVTCFGEGAQTGIDVLAWLEAGRHTEPRLPASQEGLTICQQLVEAMGGAVALSLDELRWSAHLAWSTASLLKVLIIDDNVGFVQLYRRYLAGHNWQVIGAANGQEARRVIAEVQPTVILLDVLLPQEDGWELLIALKTGAATRDIPVIVCSVINQPKLALALGAADYLPKPVTQQALLEALSPWR
jgi:CheY-like chemotaxis protein